MRTRWWRRRDRTSNIVDPVASCEAFLEGRYLDLACDAGEVPPAWVWLSVFVHGDAANIAALACRQGPTPPGLAPWWKLQAHLASHLLETLDTCGETLEELQRKALLPLELALIGTSTGPTTLARRFTTALDGFVVARSARERSGSAETTTAGAAPRSTARGLFGAEARPTTSRAPDASRCPHCGARVSGVARRFLDDAELLAAPLRCSNCGHAVAMRPS